MREFIVVLLLTALPPSVFSQDVRLDAALRDAHTLIERMQQFDTNGVGSLLYTEPMERMGVDIARVKEQAAKLDGSLRSIGATYLLFTLGTPTAPFSRPEGLFTLIPYTCVMRANGKTVQQDAFFVAVSKDSGHTWKFLDGIATAKVPIGSILPNYAGPELPLVRRSPVP
jgi:hypothetical protein